MNANQDTIESHESARTFVKATRQATVQPHKHMETPLTPTTKSVALREKDNSTITIDGSKESAIDEIVARMPALFNGDDSEDDSDEHGDASIRPIAEMPARRNEDGSEDNDHSGELDSDHSASHYVAYDEYRDDEYHYDGYYHNDDEYRYDDDRYNYDHYDDDDDEFLYGGFTDNWEDYYDSVYN